MSAYHRELLAEPTRCGACDRYVTECVTAPCADSAAQAECLCCATTHPVDALTRALCARTA